jgi:hypothetical protein
VVIIKIEYLKQKASRILEQWFEENSTPMSKETIEMFADELELDPETFHKMHDMFMEDRTLFGKDNHELNKLIYNDKRQQTLSRINTVVKPDDEGTSISHIFQTQPKSEVQPLNRHEGVKESDKKRRSKHSRQRARHRSKSHERDTTNQSPVGLVVRRETSQARKLQDKATRLKAEEERLRDINQEAIRGEEAAKIRIESAMSRRKEDDAAVRQQAKEEYERAKREAEEYAELRRQAEVALQQAIRRTEKAQQELEEQRLLLRSQADFEIRKAREVLQQEAQEREDRWTEERRQKEKQLQEEKERFAKEKSAQLKELEEKKLVFNQEVKKHKDQETTKSFMKKAAVALIDRKLKDEQASKKIASKETVLETQKAGSQSLASSANEKTGNFKQESQTSAGGKGTENTMKIKDEHQSPTQTLKESEVRILSDHKTETEFYHAEQKQSGPQDNSPTQVKTHPAQAKKVEERDHNHKPACTTPFDDPDSPTAQGKDQRSLHKNEKQDHDRLRLSAAEADRLPYEHRDDERPVDESYETSPHAPSVDDIEPHADSMVLPDKNSEIDDEDESENSFEFVPVKPEREVRESWQSEKARSGQTVHQSARVDPQEAHRTAEHASYKEQKSVVSGQKSGQKSVNSIKQTEHAHASESIYQSGHKVGTDTVAKDTGNREKAKRSQAKGYSE